MTGDAKTYSRIYAGWHRGMTRANAEKRRREISAETLRDYGLMATRLLARARGATPLDVLRSVQALENAERVRVEYDVPA